MKPEFDEDENGLTQKLFIWLVDIVLIALAGFLVFRILVGVVADWLGIR